jgi:hypothetical protein
MDPATDPQLADRLATEPNIWLATVRPDGPPHLVAIWFVHVDGRIWVCTGASSVKVGNIAADPRTTFSLEDGNRSVIGEGTAHVSPMPYPTAVISAFVEKFDWDITSPDSAMGELALIRIDVDRWRQ